MRSIIIGAGELGRSIAELLFRDGNDVVVIDTDDDLLALLKTRLDILTIEGNGASIQTLKEAGIENACHLIAASGDDSTNLLACQQARRFGVPTTICRLRSREFFSEKDDISPESFGISKVIIPEEECVNKIINCIDNQYIIERIMFSNPDAILTAVEILQDSAIIGFPLRLLPEPERLEKIRIVCVIRRRELIIPHGDTIIYPGDEVYIAGERTAVQETVEWLTPLHRPLKSVVIAGASRLGLKVADSLYRCGYHVCIIEPDSEQSEKALNEMELSIMIVDGNPTNNDILREAGVDSCDVFISALGDDEDNILCGILAKRLGALKVIVMTNKSEYIDVVPEIERIDSGFNSCLVALNSVLQVMPHDIDAVFSIGAVLQRANAFIYEFRVDKTSLVCNRKIQDCQCPPGAIFALLFRDGKVLTPTGNLQLLAGDTVAVITTRDVLKELIRFFKFKNSIFNF